MSNTIKKLKIVFFLLALFMIQIEVTAQVGTAESKMSDLRALIHAHIEQPVTNEMFRQYMTTSSDNIEMFKEIQKTMNEHPNFDSDQVAALISAMESKLASIE